MWQDLLLLLVKLVFSDTKSCNTKQARETPSSENGYHQFNYQFLQIYLNMFVKQKELYKSRQQVKAQLLFQDIWQLTEKIETKNVQSVKSFVCPLTMSWAALLFINQKFNEGTARSLKTLQALT